MLSAQPHSGSSSRGQDNKSKGVSKARDAEVQNIHRAFDVIDKDRSGQVDRSEVRLHRTPRLR